MPEAVITGLDLPPLPLEEWEDTKVTLHLFLQIVGKIRLRAHPKLNHWWHVTLYPGVQGLTTGRMPYGAGTFEISFDFFNHSLTVVSSGSNTVRFPIAGLSVADFYAKLMQTLSTLGIAIDIHARPYDHKSTKPFALDHEHNSYDPDAVNRFWRALSSVASVFEEFRGQFIGKSTPVHLFWHSFDLALTRFSGRAAPLEGGTKADREAYSHEVISFGFWAGDDNVREAAFYSYAYPEPAGLADEPLSPAEAQWVEKDGSHLAFLSYEALRESDNPKAILLSFMQSAYDGAAKRADWPVDALKHKALLSP